MNKLNLKKRVEEVRKQESEWYNLRPILGNANWAIFYILLGGREAGKSYSVTNFFVDQFVNKGIPFMWLRLTDKQTGELLKNNAAKLIDPDLRRKYNLDLETLGDTVYSVERETYEVTHKDGTKETLSKVVKRTIMARVHAISTFYNDKGSIFDKDFLNDLAMRYNVAIDEFEREKGEKNTFDITYALVNQLENLLRSTINRTKIFFLGNTLESASDVLCAFNFIPETFGTFHLVRHKRELVDIMKKLDSPDAHIRKEARKEYGNLILKQPGYFGKRCVIQNLEPSEKYKRRRAGTIADMLTPTASTFTNKIEVDKSLVCKDRLITPEYVIKFTKSKDDWFTVWNNNIIAKYNGEQKSVVAMRPYLDEIFIADNQKEIIKQFNTRCFLFRNLITFKQLQKNIELLCPSK